MSLCVCGSFCSLPSQNRLSCWALQDMGLAASPGLAAAPVTALALSSPPLETRGPHWGKLMKAQMQGGCGEGAIPAPSLSVTPVVRVLKETAIPRDSGCAQIPHVGSMHICLNMTGESPLCRIRPSSLPGAGATPEGELRERGFPRDAEGRF